MTLGVDFDGVIHDYLHGWKDGSIYGDLVPGAKSALESMLEADSVFIFTTREPEPVAKWVTEKTGIETTTEEDPDVHGRPFWNPEGIILVTNRKMAAWAYIDDRGIRFKDWNQTMRDLHTFTKLFVPGFGL